MAPLLSLLLAVAPAVPPPTALLLARRTNLTQADALSLARDTVVQLEAGGLPISLAPDGAAKKLARLGVTDTSACAGKRACVAELGKQLLVEWVVSVSVGRIDADRSLALELLKVADQSVAARDTVLLTGQTPLAAEQVAAFTEAARKALGLVAPTPPPPVDVPRKDPEVVVTPKEVPPPPPPLVVTPPPAPVPPPRGHGAQLAMGGVGLVAVVAGATLLALGLAARGDLAQGTSVGGHTLSPLTGSAAQATVRRSNLQLGFGGGALAVGAGLGLTAAFTW